MSLGVLISTRPRVDICRDQHLCSFKRTENILRSLIVVNNYLCKGEDQIFFILLHLNHNNDEGSYFRFAKIFRSEFKKLK